MLGRHRRSRRRSTRCTDFCIDLRDDLLARAKELAAKERTSLTKIIEEGLVLRLCRQRAFRGRLKELPRSAGEAVCATESTPRATVRSSSQRTRDSGRQCADRGLSPRTSSPSIDRGLRGLGRS